MCLTKVTRRRWFPSNKIVQGWKVFVRWQNGQLWTSIRKNRVESGVWLKAKEIALPRRIDQLKGNRGYRSGFHVLASANDAHAYKEYDSQIVLPVFVRKVRTEGYEIDTWSGRQCVVLVADELYIPTEAELEQMQRADRDKAIDKIIAELDAL